MAERDFLTAPDAHLDPVVAATDDGPADDMFGAATVGATVAVLAELADGGSAVEFAVGTGRTDLRASR
ncbi:MAG: hypothetical protein AAF567_18595 [Actinomycetota bacterium]